MRDKVTRRCPQTTTFEEKEEPKPISTEVPPLTSLTPYRQAKPAHRQPGMCIGLFKRDWGHEAKHTIFQLVFTVKTTSKQTNIHDRMSHWADSVSLFHHSLWQKWVWDALSWLFLCFSAYCDRCGCEMRKADCFSVSVLTVTDVGVRCTKLTVPVSVFTVTEVGVRCTEQTLFLCFSADCDRSGCEMHWADSVPLFWCWLWQKWVWDALSRLCSSVSVLTAQGCGWLRCGCRSRWLTSWVWQRTRSTFQPSWTGARNRLKRNSGMVSPMVVTIFWCVFSSHVELFSPTDAVVASQFWSCSWQKHFTLHISQRLCRQDFCCCCCKFFMIIAPFELKSFFFFLWQ